MKIFKDYFGYLIRHKWLVFKYCYTYGITWQGITHDLSKFLPSEFIEYSKYFASGKKTDIEYKWLDHLHRNKHHWQYWILLDNEGGQRALEMPKKYILEMISDWLSVAVIEHGNRGAIDWVKNWYNNRKDKMIIHPKSKQILEKELGKLW